MKANKPLGHTKLLFKTKSDSWSLLIVLVVPGSEDKIFGITCHFLVIETIGIKLGTFCVKNIYSTTESWRCGWHPLRFPCCIIAWKVFHKAFRQLPQNGLPCCRGFLAAVHWLLETSLGGGAYLKSLEATWCEIKLLKALVCMWVERKELNIYTPTFMRCPSITLAWKLNLKGLTWSIKTAPSIIRVLSQSLWAKSFIKLEAARTRKNTLHSIQAWRSSLKLLFYPENILISLEQGGAEVL